MSNAELLRDCLAAAGVVTVTALLGRASSRISGRLLDSRGSFLSPDDGAKATDVGLDPADLPIRLAATLLLAWATIVLGSIVLSISGLLHPVTLLTTVLMASLPAAWCYRDYCCHMFTRQLDIVLLIPAALAATQVCFFGLNLLPVDWDTLAYHLPMIDHWVQSGNLADTSTAFWYVPGNFELLGYFFSGAFSGDFWVQLANGPVVLLLAAASLALCHELGIAHRTARWICFGAVVNPVVLRQIRTLENDVAVAALFVAATLFGMRAVRSGQLGALLLCGIATSLLGGVKYYSVAHYLVVATAVTVLIVMQNGFWQGARAFCVFAIGFTAFASFWYGRNFLLTGTPLYPKGLTFLGFDGPWDELRPGFARTCLALGFRQSDTPLLVRAWITHGGLLLPFTLLLAPVCSLARTGVLLPTLLLRQIRSSAPEQSADASSLSEVKTRPESLVSSDKGDMSGQLVLQLCVLGGLLAYCVTPNVLETYADGRNMLRLQYHPVRFGFAAALLAMIAVSHLVILTLQRVREYDAPSSIREAGPESTPGFLQAVRRRLLLYLTAVIRTIPEPFRRSVLPLLLLMTAAIALLPQFGWRRIFLDHGFRVWQPKGPDYDAFLLFVGVINIVVTLAVLHTLLVSQHKWRRVIGIGLITSFPLIATPFLAVRWHEKYDQHFQAIGPISLAAPIGQAIAGHTAVVCEYRYYATLGSRRQNDVSRPLFVADDTEFRDYLKMRNADVVVTVRRDRQWSQAYANCDNYLSQPKSGFILLETIGNYSIFRKR